MSDVEALVQRLMTAGSSTREAYILALEWLDKAVCEASAVGQAQAGRMAAPCVGYGTYLFARMCSHGVAAVRAMPYSRWVRSDHQEWGFNVLACHARALLEGNLYFHYFMQPADETLDESRARVTLLQLNDCCSRLRMFAGSEQQRFWFEQQLDDLQACLRSLPFFLKLSPPLQAQCLIGKKAWCPDRAQLVELLGMDKAGFDIL